MLENVLYVSLNFLLFNEMDDCSLFVLNTMQKEVVAWTTGSSISTRRDHFGGFASNRNHDKDFCGG